MNTENHSQVVITDVKMPPNIPPSIAITTAPNMPKIMKAGIDAIANFTMKMTMDINGMGRF